MGTLHGAQTHTTGIYVVELKQENCLEEVFKFRHHYLMGENEGESVISVTLNNCF